MALECGFTWRWLDGFRNQIFAVIQVLLLLTQTFASPVWMPQFLSGGTGRNIRHLPCVSRRTGEQGTCMFAYTCMKSNGTHLGTCIDRFYFGSCCKLQDGSDPVLDNDINYPVVNNNKINEPFLHPSVGTIIDAVKLGTTSSSEATTTTTTSRRTTSAPTTSRKPTTSKTTTSTEKVYVPILTSSSKPNKTDSGIFSEVLKKPVTTTMTEKTPLTTTQQYLLSTFQVVHDNNEVTTPTVPTTTISKTTSVTSNWTVVEQDNLNKTTTKAPVKISTTTTAKPKPTTTKKPTKPPTKTSTTRKPPTKKPTSKPTTSKPTKVTSKPTVPTKKPPSTTKKPVSSSPVYKPVSTISATTSKPTKKPATTTTTTKRPQSITKRPQSTTPVSSTLALLSTTSEIVFTKPGSDFFTTNFSDFSTFRPDLSETTRPSLVTGPGLTTFSYISDKITTPTAPTSISNDVATEKTSTTPPVIEIVEEQSNVIFQQAGTPATSSTSQQTSTEGTELNTSEPTKVPWVEIVQEQSTADVTTTVTSSESLPATDESSTSSTESSTFSPSFGNLNVSDFTQVCGRRLYPEARVVGGEKSTFGKWPWQISLRQWRTSTYLHKCGAALLNENWAITAAHCVENVPPSDLLLRLGEHDLSTEEEPFGYQERRVQIVASHPQFDPRTFEYDLALLRFYEPVKFQPNIIPVCVPEDSTNFVGQTAHVTGWGRLYEDGPLPSVLQEVSVPVINNSICENMYRSAGYIEHIPDIFICAGWKKGGFDSCEGDSGGPMVIQRPDRRWLLAGVISWGIGCAEPNQPGVYTRISEFREWINQILQF